MKRMFTSSETREFSLSRALVTASEGGLRGSLEAEMLQEATQRAGKQYTDVQFYVPFELMTQTRDMSAAGVLGSQYLVGEEAPFALDVLRPYSATLRAGAQMMEFKGNASVPKVAAPSTGYWLADEFTAITESQATIGEVALAPKNCGIITEISAQLSRQANIDAFMRRELLRTMGSTLDGAIFSGTGASGQPLGIHATTGVVGVSGTSIDWTDVTDLLYAVAEADGQEGVSWFAPPAVRRLLSRRERITGGGRSIWDDNAIAGYPAIASRVAPADTLTVGAFGEVIVALFADGVEITVNPYSDFTRGFIQYRAWLAADIAVTAPAAFAVAKSIT